MAEFEIKDGVAIIPEGIDKIEDNAFSGCKELTSVEIPTSVKSVGSRAFENCTGLTSVELPDSVAK